MCGEGKARPQIVDVVWNLRLDCLRSARLSSSIHRDQRSVFLSSLPRPIDCDKERRQTNTVGTRPLAPFTWPRAHKGAEAGRRAHDPDQDDPAPVL